MENGHPIIYTTKGVRSVRRIVWEVGHKYPPLGYLKTTCGNDKCVTPDHLVDSETRPKNVRRSGYVQGLVRAYVEETGRFPVKRPDARL